MASYPIRWIRARAHCQATEEENRVAAALKTVVNGGIPAREILTGQFGNPVLALSRSLDRAAELRATWALWTETGILAALERDLDGRVDEDAVLHLRFDKQEAAQGRIALHRDADAIDVQVKLKAYPATPEEIRRVAHALFAEAV